jgi:hypothetical protein
MRRAWHSTDWHGTAWHCRKLDDRLIGYPARAQDLPRNASCSAGSTHRVRSVNRKRLVQFLSASRRELNPVVRRRPGLGPVVISAMNTRSRWLPGWRWRDLKVARCFAYFPDWTKPLRGSFVSC